MKRTSSGSNWSLECTSMTAAPFSWLQGREGSVRLISALESLFSEFTVTTLLVMCSASGELLCLCHVCLPGNYNVPSQLRSFTFFLCLLLPLIGQGPGYMARVEILVSMVFGMQILAFRCDAIANNGFIWHLVAC